MPNGTDEVLATTDLARSAMGSTIPAWVLVVPLRLFLAVGWLRAAAEKVVDERWWTGEEVRSFLDSERRNALPFVRPLMDAALHADARWIAAAVVMAELLIALALLTGWCMRAGLWAGVALNLVFVACGRVNPSAFYLVMELALLTVLVERRTGAPRRRALPLSLLSLVAAVAMMPFIRSLQPAALVADPAAMLSFLGVLVAMVGLVRWSVRSPDNGSRGVATRLAAATVAWADADRRLPTRVARSALPDVSDPSAWLAPPTTEVVDRQPMSVPAAQRWSP